MNATQKTYRLSKLEARHLAMFNLLTTSPQSLTKLASAAGVAMDVAERQLSHLVDDALAVRTMGDRTSAMYTAAS